MDNGHMDSDVFHARLEKLWRGAAERYKVHPKFAQAMYCGLADSLIYSIRMKHKGLEDTETISAGPQVAEMMLKMCSEALGYKYEIIKPMMLDSLKEVAMLVGEALGVVVFAGVLNRTTVEGNQTVN